MDFKKVLNGSVSDFNVVNGDIENSDGIEEVIINSLYTDARVNGENGWWGDAYNNGHIIGSKLWTLRNAKATVETKNLAKQYCIDALAWLIEDNIAERITVITQWLEVGVLYIEVNLYTNNSHRVFKFKESL